MLRYCSHADCRRFRHPGDFESEFDTEDQRATCRRHRMSSAKSPRGSKKASPEAKKESQGHGAWVRGAAAWDAGGEGLMEETSIMGHETEEPPSKQLCFRPCGGARVHAPARSPGDSSTLPSRLTATPPAIAHRFELDEVSEADIDLCPVDKAIEMVAEVTEAEARVPAEAEHAEAATAPKQYSYAHEDIQKPEGWGFLEGHDLGVHPEGGDLGMRGDILLQWEDS